MSTKVSFETAIANLSSPGRPSVAGLQGLSGLSRSRLQRFSTVWATLPVERRRWAADALAELEEDSFELDFAPVFKAILTDPDPQVRRRAIAALWGNDDVELADTLLTLLAEDPSPEVRAAAAGALGYFTYLTEMLEIPDEVAARTRAGLLATIRSQEPVDVRRRAIEAIGFLSGDDEVSEVIEHAYASGDALMRMAAVFAMGRSCDRRYLPAVLRELENEDPAMRFEAARAAGEIEDKSAVPRLLRLLMDPDREVKLATIQALGAIGGERAIEALRVLTESDDEAVAEAAEDALAEAEFAESPLDFGLDDILPKPER